MYRDITPDSLITDQMPTPRPRNTRHTSAGTSEAGVPAREGDRAPRRHTLHPNSSPLIDDKTATRSSHNTRLSVVCSAECSSAGTSEADVSSRLRDRAPRHQALHPDSSSLINDKMTAQSFHATHETLNALPAGTAGADVPTREGDRAPGHQGAEHSGRQPRHVQARRFWRLQVVQRN